MTYRLLARCSHADVAGKAATRTRHLGDDPLRARVAAGREEHPFERKDLGERGKLVARHPPRPNQYENPAVRAREVPRRKRSPRPGPQIGEVARLQHRLRMAAHPVEEADEPAHARKPALVVVVEIRDDLDAVAGSAAQERRVEDSDARRRLRGHEAAQPLDRSALREQSEGLRLSLDRACHVESRAAIGLRQDAKLHWSFTEVCSWPTLAPAASSSSRMDVCTTTPATWISPLLPISSPSTA